MVDAPGDRNACRHIDLPGAFKHSEKSEKGYLNKNDLKRDQNSAGRSAGDPEFDLKRDQNSAGRSAGDPEFEQEPAGVVFSGRTWYYERVKYEAERQRKEK